MLLLIKMDLNILPCKHGAYSPKTPEAKHSKVAIGLKDAWPDFPYNFRRDCGNHIQNKPAFYISPSNLFWVINEKISSFIKVGNKECQDNIYSKKCIHNIVRDGKRSTRCF